MNLQDKAKTFDEWADIWQKLFLERKEKELNTTKLLRFEDAQQQINKEKLQRNYVILAREMLEKEVERLGAVLAEAQKHLDRYPKCQDCDFWNDAEESCEQAWGLYCPRDKWLGELRGILGKQGDQQK